jgi:hypothetical protein
MPSGYPRHSDLGARVACKQTSLAKLRSPLDELQRQINQRKRNLLPALGEDERSRSFNFLRQDHRAYTKVLLP